MTAAMMICRSEDMMKAERIDRLDSMIRDKRVVHWRAKKRRGDVELLGAIAPEVIDTGIGPAGCPVEVMPTWWAYMTQWAASALIVETGWREFLPRYAALARRWHVLDVSAWERVRIAVLSAILSEVRDEAGEVVGTLDGVLDWLRRDAPELERAELRDRAQTMTSLQLGTWYVICALRWATSNDVRGPAFAAQDAKVARGVDAANAVAARLVAGVLGALTAEIERAEQRA